MVDMHGYLFISLTLCVLVSVSGQFYNVDEVEDADEKILNVEDRTKYTGKKTHVLLDWGCYSRLIGDVHIRPCILKYTYIYIYSMFYSVSIIDTRDILVILIVVAGFNDRVYLKSF